VIAMPVQIDDFHTEIEFTPTKPAEGGAATGSAAAQPSVVQAKVDARALLTCLEAELDHYLRQRG
jgi:hypothetical protein